MRGGQLERRLAAGMVIAAAIACRGEGATGIGPVDPVVRDASAPTIALAVSQSITRDSTVTVSASIDDDRAVWTVAMERVNGDGVRAMVPVSIQPAAHVTLAERQSIGAGTTWFRVTATDSTGNVKTDSVAVTQDRVAPQIVWIVAPWSVPGDSATLSVELAASPESALDVSYSIDGGPESSPRRTPLIPGQFAPSPPYLQGRTALTVPLVRDSESVTIVVRDAAGNARRKQLSLRRREAVQQVASGGTLCFLTVSGRAFCQGSNSAGQLGTGDTRDAPDPRPVAGDLRFRTVATGGYRGCGITLDGALYCWGSQVNAFFQPTSTALTPQRIALPGGLVTSVAVGLWHLCATTSDGAAYCWGINDSGQLGDSSTTERASAVRVATDVAFDSISVSMTSTCARSQSHHVWCWGSNYDGEFGNVTHGSAAPTVAPVLAASGREFDGIVSVERAFCGVTASGEAWCWGRPMEPLFGSVGDISFPDPVRMAVPEPTVSLAVGVRACAVGSSGKTYCWGHHELGALGSIFVDDRDFGVTFTPLRVLSELRLRQVSDECGLTTDGALYCWSASSGYASDANAP